MSDTKRFIILPYTGNHNEALSLERIRAIKPKRIKTDHIHKFLDYVQILEKIVISSRNKDWATYNKYMKKLDEFEFVYIKDEHLQKEVKGDM